MTWRDEPLTKGEFVDALTAALQRNKKGADGVLEHFEGMKRHQPAMYQILRLIFQCDETTLETMRDYIKAEGAISDALSNSYDGERDRHGEVPGAGGS